jgi:type I restriction enzyme S subunit
VSELPQGWMTATLQDVATWSSGGTPSRSIPAYYLGSIPWFKTGELGPRVLSESEEHISVEAVNASSAKIFPKGSVAVAMYGATIGKTSIFGVDAATNQACAVGIPQAVSTEFLYYFLISQEKGFIDSGKGGAQPNISQGIVKAWPLCLPPVSEQTRIVEKLEELLSDLDAGVAELKAARKKLGQYRQSLLKAAVEGALTAEWRKQNVPFETGAQLLDRILLERRARWEAKQLAKFKEQGKTPPKDWQKKYPEPVQPDTSDLPVLPEGWVWASVDQLLADIETGKSFKCEERPPRVGEVGVVKVSAVSWGQYNEEESKTCQDESMIRPDLFVQTGDFLFSRANTIELVGACVIAQNVTKQVMLSDKILRFILVRDGLKNWLLTLLRSELGRYHIELFASGNQESMRNIGQERIRQIPVPLPPMSEVQYVTELLAEGIDGAKAQESVIAISLKQTTAQRQNILRAAFAGQLVPQDPTDEPASVLLERIRTERAAHAAVNKPRGRKVRATAA